MRTLILGAGAVGGYFGGRLVENGADVTFLVRPHRKKKLEEKGLVIRSVHGDARLPVKVITAGEQAAPFDLVILGVKAYHLEEALPALEPYLGENTVILPLLNGIIHLDRLKQTFGEERVLGGLCFIETTLNEEGEVEQYSQRHDLVFGELDGRPSERVNRILELFADCRAHVRASGKIIREMWNKYIFISTFSGITSLMNSSIGPILRTEAGRETTRRLLSEIAMIARYRDESVEERITDKVFNVILELEPSMKSSMLRDIEKGAPVEADHLHGALIDMAPKGMDLPLLKAVYAHLKTYERNRQVPVPQ